MNNWKEADLFDWLKENAYLDLVKAKNQMSRWDCYSPSTGHRIELKCRKKHYDTLLLERKKYDAMVLEANKHLDTPVYINSTPEGIYSFNLYFIKKAWETNFLNPATTQFANTKRIAKEVTYLKTTDGKKLL
jgi:hypothetical protein